jgi:TRAP-type mannitol/chloroaromatic compound transport system permease small subunit
MFFQKLARLADRLNQLVGSAIMWLTLLMMLTTVAVVLLRYVFQAGNLILLQESVIYMHSACFLLGAGWTLGRNGHVRVDVFYRRWSARSKAWIDALGTLIFLFPVAFFILLSSLDYVGQSWAIGETSAEPGGIPALYLLKTMIPAMAVLLILQGIAELIRNATVLINADPAEGSQSADGSLPTESSI